MEYNGVSELNGSYKLSQKVIYRLISSTENDTVSNYEILAMIYFSNISDISGNIEYFRIPSLSSAIGCSRRSAYNIIHNLVRKSLIQISPSVWSGYRTIKILDNNFSNSTYEEDRYLNTNHTYFNHNHVDFEEFKKLSLYAKKTLLLILLKYNRKYGYRINISTLMQDLGISKKYRIIGYITELRKMFDDSFFLIEEGVRVKYNNLRVVSKNPFFMAQTGIDDDQDTYFKHKYRALFERERIDYRLIADDTGNSLQRLYSFTVSYLNKGLSLDVIEDAIQKEVRESGELNELSFIRLTEFFQKTYPLKCG